MNTTYKNIDYIPQNLMVPAAAVTDSSVAIIWDKPKNHKEIVSYNIYCNKKFIGNCSYTDYTIGDLDNGMIYEIYICGVLQDGELTSPSSKISVVTKSKSKVIDIRDFGAVGDGKTLNTSAIQAAIDACEEGGTVYVSRGVYLTGAIFLKSDMTLYVDIEGTLLGSQDTKDYPILDYRWEGLETACYSSLINTRVSKEMIERGERLNNITIEGLGRIDANGEKLRQGEITELLGKPGRAICIRNADNVYLKDITVKQSPAWCVHIIYCNNISVNNVKIFSKCDEDGRRYKDIINGDGLNPDSCKNVYIFHSLISSQDDCIAIKSGRNEEGRRVGIATEHVRISNCKFVSGFGVAIGSEMSGSVRHVEVKDCIFEDVYSLGTIKAPRGRGGIVEDILYEDIIHRNYNLEHHDCKWFRGAINVDQYYSLDSYEDNTKYEFNEGTPVFKNITFRNIVLDTKAGNAIFLAGLPESPLENILLENINASGKYGMKAKNIKGLAVTNVSVASREDEAYWYENVSE